ncbi:tetratricopeptide repeat domain-containing protein [Chaetomium fimeti]|uniref:Tetratricopeptide repeat domain-containing protein n=1 Tax=Chaetomium fimeti TaxID=1854472 RepID=A0AAE0HC00_9PEZI|nr:tetratricopeptide repeat domain-containing protein [Chaetomium fimeti]
MADPFSIVAGAIGVAEISFRLVLHIHQLRQDIDGIDSELESLAEELDSLRELCDAVQSTFAAKTRDASPGLWKHLGRALENCRGVLTKLDEVVSKIERPSSSLAPGKINNMMMALRKKLREGDLRNCRTHLATYQKALQLVLSTVTFQCVSDSHTYNMRSFTDISNEFQDLGQSLEYQITNLRHTAKSTDSSHYDQAAVSALEELRESVTSAALAIQSASTNHHFDIPQSVSSIFTGREILLQELQRLFVPRPGMMRDEMQRRFIIHGVGGSGKTQFCCKFAQDNRDSFWGVFWIDASTRERAKHTLAAIAETAGLDKNENAALHWLSNLEHRWLLIIDNVDDEDAPLESYFPKGNRGNILVTTRNPACKIHGNVGPGFYDFRGLDLPEATRLLLKASGNPDPWDPSCEALASTITKALGFLALAIIHAGAAIRDQLCNLHNYLDYYGRSRQRIRNATLTEKGTAAESAVFATWEICYERLEHKGTGAAADALELLNVLAFLHWEAISPDIFTRALQNPVLEAGQEEDTPEGEPGGLLSKIIAFLLGLKSRTPPLLPNVLRNTSPQGGIEECEDRVRLALKQLAHMSLIIRNDHNDTYYMHPIVHTWARERPRMRLGEQALWADVTGRLLASSILLPPLGSSAADEKYHIGLLPHIEHVQECRRVAAGNISSARGRKPAHDWFTKLLPTLGPDRDRLLMYAKFSLVYAKCGRWASAERLMKEVSETLRHYLGLQNKRTRQATLFLATVYWNMGRATDAALLQVSVLEACKGHLGSSHTDTLRAMSELGRTRWQQGEYTAALALQKPVLHELSLRLPEDHPDLLEAMDNLGMTMQKFWETHHFEEAFRLHSLAAEGMSRVHGPDHERTLLAKESLCRVAVQLGGPRMKPALDTMSDVLEVRRARLGKEHPYTLLAMVNLAIVLSASGHTGEALDLIRWGLPIADRNLGRDHIGTLFGRHTLACILAQVGRYAEAEDLLVLVTESQKRMGSHRGNYHPDRLGALIELARCQYMLGKVDAAIAVCDEAIQGFDIISVEPHPLALGLRTARAGMLKLESERSNLVLGTFRPEEHDITFPFVLFKVSGDAEKRSYPAMVSYGSDEDVERDGYPVDLMS